MNNYKEGWPEKNKIPTNLKVFQNDLYLVEGLLFLNDKIVVPKKMLSLIHEFHLGVEKYKSWTHEIVYWLGISRDIEKVIAEYAICAKFRKNQMNESLLPHTLPERPF